MSINKIIKLFEKGSVCVTGQRGAGKDMLFANIIARRNEPYVSNSDYGGDFTSLDLSKLDCGKNTYDNFINGNILPYIYPYPQGADIYITDCGIYLPSQYCNELNKKYPYLPTFFALSRHLGNCNVHINTQNLNRVWDKLREQSDTYIRCRWCKVICGMVFQSITVYSRADTCQARVEPCRVRMPSIFAEPERREQVLMYLDNFYNSHGEVKNYLLIYPNKSTYDTRLFKAILERRENEEETTTSAT